MFKKVIMKWLILKMAVISPGMGLTLEQGLTSGKTLDYIYRNRPSGKSLASRMVDKIYLSHPGWEAVRIRKRHLEMLLSESLHTKGEGALVVDMASGPGSYILQVMKGHESATALCFDLDPRWVEEGNRRAEKLLLDSRVHYKQGNAFDLPHLDIEPSIIVSSGFYDWMLEDEKVLESIAQVYECLPSGGIFLLTIQCRHPNLKFVEEVFQDFNHQPLKMKMRDPQTVAGWLKEKGFSVQKALMDPHHYYCVFKAVKEV